MEQQTIYLISPLFTQNNPLLSGIPQNLQEKVSGRDCVLPACHAINEICLQRIGNIGGSYLPANVRVGTFNDGGELSGEFPMYKLLDEDVCHMSYHSQDLRSSNQDLYLQIESDGVNKSITQGQFFITIKYKPMGLAPQSTKSTPQQPIKYKVTNSPFGNPTTQN